MSKGLFVTATGTDVGKTYVTALLVKKLRQAGLNGGYYKAALSGALPTAAGLIPGDAHYVQQMAAIPAEPRELVSYIYEEAVSPHLAARWNGRFPELAQIVADYQRLGERFDYLTVEGSGGIICPLCWEPGRQLWLADVIQALQLDTLVVAEAGLGTLNATLLTLEYLAHQGITTRGVIVNRFHPGDRLEEDNVRMLEQLAGVPVLARIEENAGDLALEAQAVAALYK